MGVYPRECGATKAVSARKSSRYGLSPRVRGNRWWMYYQDNHVRSIPASAGQPWVQSLKNLSRKVYPRECGATAVISSMAARTWGLSPRVRGNPCRASRSVAFCRSIPASAGQPMQQERRYCRVRVYPRECGATVPDSSNNPTLNGLSPRVRGNP